MEQNKQECPFCGNEIDIDATQCPECGEALLKNCPYCGENIKTNAKKCPHCGECFYKISSNNKDINDYAKLGLLICLLIIIFFTLAIMPNDIGLNKNNLETEDKVIAKETLKCESPVVKDAVTKLFKKDLYRFFTNVFGENVPAKLILTDINLIEYIESEKVYRCSGTMIFASESGIYNEHGRAYLGYYVQNAEDGTYVRLYLQTNPYLQATTKIDVWE